MSTLQHVQFRIDFISPYLAQMITTMKRCVMYNGLLPWPISSRSFGHHFTMKLLKYGTLAVSTLQHIQFVMDSFHIWHKWLSPLEGVSHTRLLMLTYIFKVIQPWLCSKTAKIWHILPHLLYSTYSSGWILAIFGANDHHYEWVCCTQWPLILIYIYIHPWLYNKRAKIWHFLSCLLYGM